MPFPLQLTKKSKTKSLRSNSLGRLLISVVLVGAPLAGGGPGFRTPHLLQDHFSKYGSGFGAITQLQYLHMAQQLRDSKPGKNILETKRADNSTAKFDRRRGWFVSYDSDGAIRTFFVPKDGIRYFELQARTNAP